MKLNMPNVNNVSGLICQSRLKKPKVIVAVVLISIMGFMWVKVLLNHRSKRNEAMAAVTRAAAEDTAAEQNQQVRMSLHPLPVVPGRNDVLTHDIFTADRWDAFPGSAGSNGAGSAGGIGSYDGDLVAKIASAITLEAVIAGANPEAFIENKLVKVGDILAVRYQDRIYEFTVAQIHETKVVLKWNDFTVDLRMSQLNESEN